jgi:hypothetical protein
MYQKLFRGASDREGMDHLKPNKNLDESTLARFLDDLETRATASGEGGPGRSEKLQSLMVALRHLPDKQFDACLQACLAVAENFAQSTARQESRKRTSEQTSQDARRLVS